MDLSAWPLLAPSWIPLYFIYYLSGHKFHIFIIYSSTVLPLFVLKLHLSSFKECPLPLGFGKRWFHPHLLPSVPPDPGGFDGICWAFVVKTEKANLGSESSFKGAYLQEPNRVWARGAGVLTVEMQEPTVVSVDKGLSITVFVEAENGADPKYITYTPK